MHNLFCTQMCKCIQHNPMENCHLLPLFDQLHQREIKKRQCFVNEGLLSKLQVGEFSEKNGLNYLNINSMVHIQKRYEICKQR